MNLTIKEFQEDHRGWVLKNFHPQHFEFAYQPLLGIIEELHELNEAITDDDVLDAVGDVMIFASDYCSCMGFDLESLTVVDQAMDFPGPLTIIGSLAHHHLKLIQKIRVNEPHLEVIKLCLKQLFAFFRTFCDLEEVVNIVWEEVKQRDWTKNAVDGKTSVN
jgi:NTP pyrophosphatase (non-canonical NTP hydrolase)